MPVYEYECQKCHAAVNIWFRSFAAASAEIPVCTACGSKRLKRLMSTPAVIYSGSSSTLGAVSAATHIENPQDLAQAMRGAARDRDMGGEFSEVAARLEKGEKSKAIEKSLRKRAGQKRGTH
jgi:putative FmdB family regulatory protein